MTESLLRNLGVSPEAPPEEHLSTCSLSSLITVYSSLLTAIAEWSAKEECKSAINVAQDESGLM